MQRIADVPSSLIDVVRGIIFTISARFTVNWLRGRRKAAKAPGKKGGEA